MRDAHVIQQSVSCCDKEWLVSSNRATPQSSSISRSQKISMKQTSDWGTPFFNKGLAPIPCCLGISCCVPTVTTCSQVVNGKDIAVFHEKVWASCWAIVTETGNISKGDFTIPTLPIFSFFLEWWCQSTNSKFWDGWTIKDWRSMIFFFQLYLTIVGDIFFPNVSHLVSNIQSWWTSFLKTTAGETTSLNERRDPAGNSSSPWLHHLCGANLPPVEIPPKVV